MSVLRWKRIYVNKTLAGWGLIITSFQNRVSSFKLMGIPIMTGRGHCWTTAQHFDEEYLICESLVQCLVIAVYVLCCYYCSLVIFHLNTKQVHFVLSVLLESRFGLIRKFLSRTDKPLNTKTTICYVKCSYKRDLLKTQPS